MSITGESTCPNCSQRVLVVRRQDDGKLIRLEPQRENGGWLPSMSHNVLVAKYVAPDEVPNRDGHHAHDLRCPVTQCLIVESRQRIARATTEMRVLPVLTSAGVRAVVNGGAFV